MDKKLIIDTHRLNEQVISETIFIEQTFKHCLVYWIDWDYMSRWPELQANS